MNFLEQINPKNIRLFFTSLLTKGVRETFRLTGLRFEKNCSLPKDSIAPGVFSGLSPLTEGFDPFSLPAVPDAVEVSIIIPVYNRWAYTYDCLKALNSACAGHSFEVIMADDGSTDETLEASQIIKNLTVIRDGQHRGFLLNCNNAAKFARGRYLYFLNNDTKCAPGCVDRLVEVFEQDPKAGIVGSKLLYPNGLLQEAGGIAWSNGNSWNYGNRQAPLKPEFCYRHESDYVSGCSFMIRRDLWERLKGFDAQFSPGYCEDVDLCFSVRDAGYRVIFQPEAWVVHYRSMSYGVDAGIDKIRNQNKHKRAAKWENILKKDQFPEGSSLFHARDRSRNRPTVLVIDHRVPRYDKDAGGRTVWSFIQAQVALGCNVKFIGDDFYPYQPYTDELQRMGVEVLWGAWYANHWEEWLKENGRYIDHVLLNRPVISVKYIKQLRRYTKARLMYYGHDLHSLREERRIQVPGEKPDNSIKKILSQELSIMQNVDVVLHLSQEEINIIKKKLPDVDVRFIQPYIFDVSAALDYDPSTRQGLLFVGGFQHPPNVDAVAWFVQEVFPGIRSQWPGIVFHIAGSHIPESIKKLASEGIKIHENISDEYLKALYSSARLVVVPLRYGAGVKGKTVEAMGHGVPVLGTPCAVEGLSDKMRSAAIICDVDAAAMVHSAVAAYNDFDRLRQLSQSGVSCVRHWFSRSGMEESWRALITKGPEPIGK